MRSTNCVEVEFLHLQEISAHICNAHNTTRFTIEIVAVYSINNDAFSINEEVATLNRDISEANLLGKGFDNGTHWIFEFNDEVIKVWLFGRPCFDIWELSCEVDSTWGRRFDLINDLHD